MTARSSTTWQQRADEMRARILRDREAWLCLMRPLRHDFDPAEYSDRNDDRFASLQSRDPRAVELDYELERRRFWSKYLNAGEVRLCARKCVLLARHLIRRAISRAA